MRQLLSLGLMCTLIFTGSCKAALKTSKSGDNRSSSAPGGAVDPSEEPTPTPTPDVVVAPTPTPTSEPTPIPPAFALGQPSTTELIKYSAGFSMAIHIFSDGTRLFVADSGNNRVLVWNTIPSSAATPAIF